MNQAMTCGPVLTSGAGMSRLPPEEVDHLREVSPAEAFLLGRRDLLRIDDDPALAAAHRDVHDGALVGHPERQRLDLVEVDVGVEAHAALGRPARDVVLHPEPVKTSMLPSSIWTGRRTSVTRRGSLMTAIWFFESFKIFAARSNCRSAFPKALIGSTRGAVAICVVKGSPPSGAVRPSKHRRDGHPRRTGSGEKAPAWRPEPGSPLTAGPRTRNRDPGQAPRPGPCLRSGEGGPLRPGGYASPVTRKTSMGPFPFTSTVPRGSHTNRARSRSAVAASPGPGRGRRGTPSAPRRSPCRPRGRR